MLNPLHETILELMLVISVVLPIPNGSVLPALQFLPQTELAYRACGRQCPVQALFNSDYGIIMDDTLDPVRNTEHKSVLLHELVHYAQWQRAGQRPAADCTEWLAREEQAKRIQYKWLNRPTPRFRRIVCIDDPVVDKQAK